MAAKKSTNATNPLANDNPIDTICNCRCAIAWMANVNDEGTGGNSDWVFGRQMLMAVIVAGLAHAEAQITAESRPRMEVVNG